ncbi:MAG TPA: hypothetical protein VIY26_00565 [Acidimicrobiales bacterium]
MSRYRPLPVLAACVLLTALVLGAEDVSSAETKSGSSSSHVIVLRGNGIGKAVFGQSETTAISGLRSVLGAPKTHEPVNLTGNCTVDTGVEWTSMTAYFFHDRFVGYATVSLLAEPTSRTPPRMATGAGLHIGDTLARAAHLYGRSLRTSYAQGGNWSAATPNGKLAGYLTSEVNSTKPAPQIADITAGSVGCPAASP